MALTYKRHEVQELDVSEVLQKFVQKQKIGESDPLRDFITTEIAGKIASVQKDYDRVKSSGIDSKHQNLGHVKINGDLKSELQEMINSRSDRDNNRTAYERLEKLIDAISNKNYKSIGDFCGFKLEKEEKRKPTGVGDDLLAILKEEEEKLQYKSFAERHAGSIERYKDNSRKPFITPDGGTVKGWTR